MIPALSLRNLVAANDHRDVGVHATAAEVAEDLAAVLVSAQAPQGTGCFEFAARLMKIDVATRNLHLSVRRTHAQR